MDGLKIKGHEFLRKAHQIVENHIAEPGFNVESLCNHLKMSRVTLHRRLRLLAHMSASEFIRSVRLKYSAGLLAEDGSNVRQSARKAGFNNLSYFSKCFREYYGVSPSEYPARSIH